MKRMMKTAARVAAVGIVLAAAAARAEAPPKGTWLFAQAGMLDKAVLKTVTARDAPYLGKTIEFKAHRVDGPGPLSCGQAVYDDSDFGADFFFQGHAENVGEDPDAIARAVGLPVPAHTIELNCDTGLFDFHMADKKTLVIMLDYVVYTIRQQ